MKMINRKFVIQVAVLILAGIFITFGVIRNEMSMVFIKAVNICLECIGIG